MALTTAHGHCSHDCRGLGVQSCQSQSQSRFSTSGRGDWRCLGRCESSKSSRCIPKLRVSAVEDLGEGCWLSPASPRRCGAPAPPRSWWPGARSWAPRCAGRSRRLSRARRDWAATLAAWGPGWCRCCLASDSPAPACPWTGPSLQPPSHLAACHSRRCRSLLFQSPSCNSLLQHQPPQASILLHL